MTRSEFYSNLQFYNSRKPVDILSHGPSWMSGDGNATKTKDGSEWGQSYYKKEDMGGGKYRYFYTKEEYDAYINNKNAQGASQDNAKGAGADYQKYLDAQKQQQQYNNSKNGAEQAAADRAAREKANREAAQVEATKQKMTNVVDNYNKSTGSKNGADEFNKAVKKLGLETEAGVQKYGGYEAALKAVEEEMNKTIEANKAKAKYNNMQAEAVKEYSEIAKKNPKSAAKEFFKEDAVTELLDEVKEGLKNKTLKFDKDGRIDTSDPEVEKRINEYSDNIQKWCKWIGTASGTGRQMQEELANIIKDEFNNYQKEEKK